jgi:hypothetical protein
MQLKNGKSFLHIVLLAGLILTGCTPGQNQKNTLTPTGAILPADANASANAGQSGTNTTPVVTLEDPTATLPAITPTVEETIEAASYTWTILVDDSKSKDTQGVAIVYSLSMILENPIGTADNAAGTYTGSVVLRESMDATQLNNTALTFTGGFDVTMESNEATIELAPYSLETYEAMGKALNYQILTPLDPAAYSYATVASIPMQGSGTVNPFVQGVQGESAGVDESTSGSGNVTFDITISPDGIVTVSSATVPVVFKGELVRGGE